MDASLQQALVYLIYGLLGFAALGVIVWFIMFCFVGRFVFKTKKEIDRAWKDFK